MIAQQDFAGVLEQHLWSALAAQDATGRVIGILPLVEIRSWLFGRTLTSLPFLNFGGVLASTDDAARALLDEAAAIARTRRCRHIELRHIGRRFDD